MPRVHAVAMISMHTSPLHQPGTGDAGGMNIYVLNVARELVQLGIKVDIFTRSEEDQTEPDVVVLTENLRVIQLPVGVGVKKNELATYAQEFARRALEFSSLTYSLIHSHYWISGLVAMEMSEKLEIPFVHTMHTMALVKERGKASGEPAESKARYPLERKICQKAARLLANTRSEAHDLEALYGAEPSRIDIVSPGVDLHNFCVDGREKDRAEKGIDPQDFHVLFAGRIQRLKGPQILVQALAILRDETPEEPQKNPVKTVASIVGAPSGEGELDLSGLVREKGLETTVTLYPPVTPRELAQWYRSADVVVMPSYAESFGLVALEAQACGTPVIAANVGGLPQAVSDERTGLIVEGHHPKDWAEALQRMRDNPELRERLAQGATVHARAFGWQRTAIFTLQAYRVSTSERAEKGQNARP